MRFPHPYPDFSQVGSVRRKLMVNEGMSVVSTSIHYKSLAASYVACIDGCVVIATDMLAVFHHCLGLNPGWGMRE